MLSAVLALPVQGFANSDWQQLISDRTASVLPQAIDWRRHACLRSRSHMAILMGVAQVLSGMRNQIPGTVKFIFQPAE